MYAVIETGGKQYRVELGSEIQVDRLEARSGDDITLDRVLLVADGEATAVGRPVVDGATVSARVLGQDRGDKIVVFKYKQKTRRRVKKGFRAELTTLRISDIAFDGKSAAADAKSSESQRATAARDAERTAAEKAAADQALAAKLAATAEQPAAGTAPKASRSAAKSKSKAAATDADAVAAESGASGGAAMADVTADEAAAPAAEEAIVTDTATAGADTAAAGTDAATADDAEAPADADSREDG